jgi:AcrR family transcriptional regulator
MPKVAPEKLEARRQEILTAAITCFARNGFHKTTMADIAAEAGVSDTLAYRYFSDKDEIIQTAMQQGIRHSDDQRIVPIDDEDISTLLRRVIEFSFQRFEMPGRREILRMRAGAWSEAWENDEVLVDVQARWQSSLNLETRLWSKAQEQSLIRSDLDTQAVGRVMQAVHDGLDLLWSHDPEIDLDECRRVVEALVLGSFWQGGPETAPTGRSA